jgi:CBS domain-containing protein
MGLHDVKKSDAEELRQFMKLLLRDVRALEQMLEDGLIEADVRRIGAEQELFIVDEAFRPASRSGDVLEALDDHQFTTELGQFNIEFNLDPVVYGGKCLSSLEDQLRNGYLKAAKTAQQMGLDIALFGILPTLQLSDLTLDNMTPNPRYFALNDALCKLRGGSYSFNIKGADEFIVQHDNVMLEACNTSFQVHFQVGAEEFAKLYNIAQLAAAPNLAAATNSPLLFGKRLWSETRIALFQQSVDTRATGHHLRERMPRVSFGNSWVNETALEIFREDIARFRVLLGTEVDEDPFEALDAGRAPTLKALRLHNGTVYRWNRVCYGISDEKPHLRIENRILPSGPSVIDEVANAAFWFGLMGALADEIDDVRGVMEFDDAKTNFISAARQGLEAPFTWIDGKTLPAQELISKTLIPAARKSLVDAGCDPDDVTKYMDVVAERVETRRTGSWWMMQSMAGLNGKKKQAEKMTALVAGGISRQASLEPVHTWTPAGDDEGAQWHDNFSHVGQFMTTDLFTVNEDELVDLVASVMEWQHLRHVPVEDDDDRLVGLVTYRRILKHLSDVKKESPSIPVKEIMETDVTTVTPDTLTIDVIKLMRESDLACVPVVKDEKLVGVVSEQDFLEIAQQLLEERFGDS